MNTPKAITDISNNLQWTWENKEAFGNNQPDENVSGTQFKFNFRFPRQYFDIETGLNYNINRDYNHVWGRYVQSDPLGLSAGLNTYGYVEGNSLSNIDPLGLDTINYGLYQGQDLGYFVGFFLEGLIKSNFDSDPNVLNLLSHGSPETMSSFDYKQIGDQIISGKFKTKNGIKYNDYYKRMLKNNNDIKIVLDACLTGVDTYNNDGSLGQRAFASNLLDYLKEKTNNKNIKISIIAPSGFVSWDIINGSTLAPISQGVYTQNPEWRTFK